MNRGVTLALCILCGLASVKAAGKWSYVGKTGPHYWHDLFPEACSGQNQSPIDIRPEQTFYNPDLKDFAIWYDPPRPDSKMYIKNTGYTVQVDLKGDFFVTNAGLGHMYKAVQFHFHWGHKSHQGSEHTIQGEMSPIELHIVTYNHDLFSDIGEAATQKGGLAVLGVLFELSEDDNPSFDYIVRGMKHIRNPEKVAKVELPLFSLRDLLPDDITRYYRYNGSLTTPGCFETVTWSVFDQKQTISYRQMDEFRKLMQMKRKHHKHHDDTEANRHKRDLSDAEKQKEHNAKQVLDELGIHSKDSAFEREALKEQLIHDKAEAGNVAKENMIEGGDNLAQTDPTEPMYVQDYIVNNFRPVQPINERTVSRSFKLRDVVVVNRYDENDGSSGNTNRVSYSGHDSGGHHHEGRGGGGASGLNVSALTVLLIVSCLSFAAKLFN